jgi:hypothetical protein
MIWKLFNCFIQEHFINSLLLLSDNIILEWYKSYSLILPLAIDANIPAKHIEGKNLIKSQRQKLRCN